MDHWPKFDKKTRKARKSETQRVLRVVESTLYFLVSVFLLIFYTHSQHNGRIMGINVNTWTKMTYFLLILGWSWGTVVIPFHKLLFMFYWEVVNKKGVLGIIHGNKVSNMKTNDCN